MLIGAHVSPAGGLAKAVERGVERGCASIQFFNQCPRMWRPRVYPDEDVAAFREAMDGLGRSRRLLIHAVYLINCATEDAEIRGEVADLADPRAADGRGDRRGRRGAAPRLGAEGRRSGRGDQRAAEAIAEALASRSAARCFSRTPPGAGGTLGRSFEELRELIEQAGGDERLGVCLDSCHLLASGYDVRTAEGLAKVVDEFDSVIGLERLGSLHVNDSKTPLGSNRDRHAPLGDGELGERGLRGVPLRAALRGAARDLRGPRDGGQGDRPG